MLQAKGQQNVPCAQRMDRFPSSQPEGVQTPFSQAYYVQPDESFRYENGEQEEKGEQRCIQNHKKNNTPKIVKFMGAKKVDSVLVAKEKAGAEVAAKEKTVEFVKLRAKNTF